MSFGFSFGDSATSQGVSERLIADPLGDSKEDGLMFGPSQSDGFTPALSFSFENFRNRSQATATARSVQARTGAAGNDRSGVVGDVLGDDEDDAFRRESCFGFAGLTGESSPIVASNSNSSIVPSDDPSSLLLRRLTPWRRTTLDSSLRSKVTASLSGTLEMDEQPLSVGRLQQAPHHWIWASTTGALGKGCLVVPKTQTRLSEDRDGHLTLRIANALSIRITVDDAATLAPFLGDKHVSENLPPHNSNPLPSAHNPPLASVPLALPTHTAPLSTHSSPVQHSPCPILSPRLNDRSCFSDTSALPIVTTDAETSPLVALHVVHHKALMEAHEQFRASVDTARAQLETQRERLNATLARQLAELTPTVAAKGEEKDAHRSGDATTTTTEADRIPLDDEDDTTCGLCCDNSVDTVLEPCQHKICRQCAKQWRGAVSKTAPVSCPWCRQPATFKLL